MTNNNENNVQDDIESEDSIESEDGLAYEVLEGLAEYMREMEEPGPPSKYLEQREALESYLMYRHGIEILRDILIDGNSAWTYLICKCGNPDLDTMRGHGLRAFAEKYDDSWEWKLEGDGAGKNGMRISELQRQSILNMTAAPILPGSETKQKEYRKKLSDKLGDRRYRDDQFAFLMRIGVAFHKMRVCGCGDSNLNKLLGYISRMHMD